MAEPRPNVDILVGQVDAAGKAGPAVDNEQLPVVPVVQPQGHHRHQPVEHPALDSLLHEGLVVVPGEGEHTAEVVIQHPDLHALGGLPLQDGQDAVPEDPGLDDEVLQKDILFRLLQLLQHPGKGLVSQGEVLGLRVGVGGTGGPALQIAGLAGGIAPQGEEVVGLEVLLQGKKGLFQHALHPLPGALGNVAAPNHQVENPAEDGEGQDEQEPGYFIAGVHPAAHNGDGGGHAEGDTAPVKDLRGREGDHHNGQRGNLGQQGQRHKHRAVEQDIQKLFHGKSPSLHKGAVGGGSLPYGWWREQATVPSVISISP